MLEAKVGMGTGAPLATGAESIIYIVKGIKTAWPTATERSEGAHNTVLFYGRRADTGARFRLITPQMAVGRSENTVLPQSSERSGAERAHTQSNQSLYLHY